MNQRQLLPAEFTPDVVSKFARLVEERRAELTQAYVKALRKTIFLNRIELRPRDLSILAENETAALLLALQTSFESSQQRGRELCLAGISIITLFEMLRTQWGFFKEDLKTELLFNDLMSLYRFQIIESFMLAREELILSEQESIRSAFQIAINHSNQKLQEAQAQAQKATENNFRNVILAQEDERRKISRELHDESGQAMVGIRMSLENLKASLPGDPELQAKLQKTITLTEKATLQIRSLAYSLRPPVLDLLGINLALKQMCIDLSDQTGLVITYKGKETPPISNELSISIYRIVQESLTNVIKHARARHAWVSLKSSRDSISLSIQDDGLGFDLETIQMGIGLESMRERSRLLNGEMKIESLPGKLTLFKYTFPVKI